MSISVTLPDSFGYVGASLLSTVFLLLGQGSTVGKYRKRAGIAYPQMYAEKAQADASKDAFQFNCAQRAHQNTLEYIPLVYAITIMTGIKYPIFAASSCALWTLSRISYSRGYIQGGPEKRVNILYLLGTVVGIIGQTAAATYVVGSWVYADLAAKFL
ncbi:Microsomal glutathione S-transferase 3 [Psilocybe cubensis]|uniref:Microsomal glutathione S-transferase 3 n=2 Tax=Psilocybe cubensis TaxID=181762 RepID=A0ACB8HFH0_PSICU|nr:Microsomal glutathione S-transferase 3 [Psilocybe cubensis]KAH9486553.1 Microsomal glutathione S-transferase 3 [Psilocybe cubensis]